MRSARLALVTAVAATSLLTASPAHATHVCALDRIDETLDDICEAHPGQGGLVQKLLCLISPSC
jgi:hypothetical protein